MKKKCVFILYLMIFCFSKADAKDTTEMIHFNMDNGFPSNNVYMILQDKSGNIWFATENGVVKYNGYTFKTFTTADGLPKDDVWKLYEDKNGRIFTFTNTEHFGYIKNDIYKNLPFNISSNTLISSYFEEWNGMYFFSNWYKNTRYLNVIKNDLALSLPFDRHLVHSIYTIGSMVYFFLFPSSLYSYDMAHPLRPIVLEAHTPFGVYVFFGENTIVWEKGGTFYTWTSTHIDSVGTLNPLNAKYNAIDFKEHEASDEHIYSFLDIGDSIVAITNKRIFNLSNQLKVIRCDSIQVSPKHPQISYRIKDRSDNTWYCTTSEGVFCKSKMPGVFHLYKFSDTLTEYHYVGEEGDSLFYWYKNGVLYQTDSKEHLRKWNIGHTSRLEQVCVYHDGSILLSYNNGLYIFNKNTGSLTNIFYEFKNFAYSSQRYFEAKRVRKIPASERPKNISMNAGSLNYVYPFIVACSHNELSVLDYSNDTLHLNGYGKVQYTKLSYDKVENKYWLYNNENIAVFIPGERRLFEVDKKIFSLYGVRNIRSIKVDDKGNVYFLHDNKLTVYNSHAGRINNIQCNINLYNAQIETLNDKLIIAGSFGVAIGNANDKEGLANVKVWVNEKKRYYNQVYNVVKTINGGIILHTDKGIFSATISSFDKSEGLIDAATYNVFNLSSTSGLVDSGQYGDTLYIQKGVNHINLEAINYDGSGVPFYSFKIVGLDSEWRQNSSGEVYFNNLSPGKYYKLSCRIKDEFWNSKEIIYYLYQSPFWWQTRTWKIFFWIIGIAGIGIVLLIVIFITRYYVARANEKKRMLTELELRAVHAQINPHFIFNTLNSALYFIDQKRFDEAYVHVQKFSKLLRAYLKSSQERFTILSEEIEMLSNYIELQKTRFEDAFEYVIEVDNKLPTHSIKIPSLLLQPLVENAINHGLFHKGGGGLLMLRFSQGKDNTELLCVIEDNGVGRNKAKEINAASSTQKESYGTKLTKQLMDVFKEFEQLDISLDYKDKTYPDSGTVVTVTIKNIKYEA